MNDGKTYSQTSGESRALQAQLAAAEAADPTSPETVALQQQADELSGKVDTLFRGETLRGLLLTSYGFSIFGDRAQQAAWVSFAAAFVLLLAVDRRVRARLHDEEGQGRSHRSSRCERVARRRLIIRRSTVSSPAAQRGNSRVRRMAAAKGRSALVGPSPIGHARSMETATSSPDVAPGHATSVIDRELEAFDVVIVESIVVDADVATTYEAARSLDFLRVRTPLLDAAFWVRGLPERFGRKQVKPPARLVLADGDPLPGWLVLGEQRGTELAFGAVGKFWQGKIEWRDVPRDDFRDFAEAGFGKIAVHASRTRLRQRPDTADLRVPDRDHERRRARPVRTVLVADPTVCRLHHARDTPHDSA